MKKGEDQRLLILVELLHLEIHYNLPFKYLQPQYYLHTGTQLLKGRDAHIISSPNTLPIKLLLNEAFEFSSKTQQAQPLFSLYNQNMRQSVLVGQAQIDIPLQTNATSDYQIKISSIYSQDGQEIGNIHFKVKIQPKLHRESSRSPLSKGISTFSSDSPQKRVQTENLILSSIPSNNTSNLGKSSELFRKMLEETEINSSDLLPKNQNPNYSQNASGSRGQSLQNSNNSQNVVSSVQSIRSSGQSIHMNSSSQNLNSQNISIACQQNQKRGDKSQDSKGRSQTNNSQDETNDQLYKEEQDISQQITTEGNLKFIERNRGERSCSPFMTKSQPPSQKGGVPDKLFKIFYKSNKQKQQQQQQLQPQDQQQIFVSDSQVKQNSNQPINQQQQQILQQYYQQKQQQQQLQQQQLAQNNQQHLKPPSSSLLQQFTQQGNSNNQQIKPPLKQQPQINQFLPGKESSNEQLEQMKKSNQILQDKLSQDEFRLQNMCQQNLLLQSQIESDNDIFKQQFTNFTESIKSCESEISTYQQLLEQAKKEKEATDEQIRDMKEKLKAKRMKVVASKQEQKILINQLDRQTIQIESQSNQTKFFSLKLPVAASSPINTIMKLIRSKRLQKDAFKNNNINKHQRCSSQQNKKRSYMKEYQDMKYSQEEQRTQYLSAFEELQGLQDELSHLKLMEETVQEKLLNLQNKLNEMGISDMDSQPLLIPFQQESSGILQQQQNQIQVKEDQASPNQFANLLEEENKKKYSVVNQQNSLLQMKEQKYEDLKPVINQQFKKNQQNKAQEQQEAYFGISHQLSRDSHKKSERSSLTRGFEWTFKSDINCEQREDSQNSCRGSLDLKNQQQEEYQNVIQQHSNLNSSSEDYIPQNHSHDFELQFQKSSSMNGNTSPSFWQPNLPLFVNKISKTSFKTKSQSGSDVDSQIDSNRDNRNKGKQLHLDGHLSPHFKQNKSNELFEGNQQIIKHLESLTAGNSPNSLNQSSNQFQQQKTKVQQRSADIVFQNVREVQNKAYNNDQDSLIVQRDINKVQLNQFNQILQQEQYSNNSSYISPSIASQQSHFRKQTTDIPQESYQTRPYSQQQQRSIHLQSMNHKSQVLPLFTQYVEDQLISPTKQAQQQGSLLYNQIVEQPRLIHKSFDNYIQQQQKQQQEQYLQALSAVQRGSSHHEFGKNQLKGQRNNNAKSEIVPNNSNQPQLYLKQSQQQSTSFRSQNSQSPSSQTVKSSSIKNSQKDDNFNNNNTQNLLNSSINKYKTQELPTTQIRMNTAPTLFNHYFSTRRKQQEQDQS